MSLIVFKKSDSGKQEALAVLATFRLSIVAWKVVNFSFHNLRVTFSSTLSSSLGMSTFSRKPIAVKQSIKETRYSLDFSIFFGFSFVVLSVLFVSLIFFVFSSEFSSAFCWKSLLFLATPFVGLF